MSRAVSRSASNSGSAATARPRRAMNCGRELASAFCSDTSAMARVALRLNSGLVETCMRWATSSDAL